MCQYLSVMSCLYSELHLSAVWPNLSEETVLDRESHTLVVYLVSILLSILLVYLLSILLVYLLSLFLILIKCQMLR